jgi:hypothetical protein
MEPVFVTQNAAQRVWRYTMTSTSLTDGRPLTPDHATALSADASPDGGSVLYALVRPGGSITQQWWLLREPAAAMALAGTDGLFAKLSRDASRIAYSKVRTDGRTHVAEEALAFRTLDGTERLLTPWVADQCCRTVCDWSPDEKAVLTCGTREMISVPIGGDGKVANPRIILTLPEHDLWEAQYSPNGRWIVFVAIGKWIDGAHLMVTAADGSAERPSWRIPVGHNWADKPRWSPDGRILYFLGGDGGLVNLWSIRFDPERGVNVGEAVQLTHFDNLRFRITPDLTATSMDIAGDKVFLTMTSTAGNIWMLDHVDR